MAGSLITASNRGVKRTGDPRGGPVPDLGAVHKRPGSRTIAERISEFGEMVVLGLQVVVVALTPPFRWWREYLRQCAFILTASFLALALAVTVYAFGGPGLQGGGYLQEVGGIDRIGGLIGVGVIRDFGVFVVASFVAGIYGTTATAELGARKIGDELEALEVLGVDITTYMVVPRVLAPMTMMSMFTSFIVVFGVIGGWIAGHVLYDATTASYIHTLFLNLSWLDVMEAYARGLIIGFLVGVVCCYKGINVSGGAEGVGRAVNEAIVGSLLVIFFINLVATMVYASLFPQIYVLR
jgi:phospholipid/cholesterol/gamma-HCH transport system permease protein